MNATNGANKSAMHYALEKDFDVCLKLLVEGGGNMDIINSLLRVSSMTGKDRCMKVLVDAGADVNQKDKTEYRHTILTLATKNGHYECMNILINAGADVNTVNRFNETALFYASNNLRCLKLLLKSGAKINIFSTKNRNALRIALWPFTSTRRDKPNVHIASLLFAAGELIDPQILRKVSRQSSNDESFAFDFLLNKDLKFCLKHLCREALREHLLKLDPHTHLFGRIPQLGLPSLVNKYLLYGMSLNDDDDEDDNAIGIDDGNRDGKYFWQL